jgi:hypothetical protein
MGFLDSLKDVGLGNTGPYGRMRSGATNYANYFQERQGVESERGISQALAGLAKDGQPINMKDMAELSDKWGIPLNEVMQRAKPMNQQNRATYMKTKMHQAAQWYSNKRKMDPSWELTEKNYTEAITELGIADDFEIQNALKDALIKMGPQNQTLAVGNNQRLANVKTPLGGPPVAKTILESDPGTPKETPLEKLKRDKDLAKYKQGLKSVTPGETSDEKLARAKELATHKAGLKPTPAQRLEDAKKLAKYKHDLKQGDSPAKASAKAGLESDIRSLAQKITGGKLGENMIESAMKSKTATQALKDAQKQMNIMVGVYEETYGAGSARRIGFDTKDDKKRQRAIQILKDDSQEQTEQNIQYVMDRL